MMLAVVCAGFMRGAGETVGASLSSLKFAKNLHFKDKLRYLFSDNVKDVGENGSVKINVLFGRKGC